MSKVREEQDIIRTAYLERADRYLGRAKTDYADNQLAATRENGLYAIELLSRAKNMMDEHPVHIQRAQGLFGRAFDGTRANLNKTLVEKIEPMFFDLQTRLQTFADTLAAKGDDTLHRALLAAKSGNTADVLRIMQASGVRAIGAAEGDTSSQSATASAGPAMSSVIGIPGATASQLGSNVVLNVPGVGQVSIPGVLSADGRYVDSPEVGRIDLSTLRRDAAGNLVAQSDRGPVYFGKDGKWHLGTPEDAAAAAMTNLTGRLPSGVVVVGPDGRRIRVDPNWQNGEQKGVAAEYGDEEGGILLSETQVTRKLVAATGKEWKAVESPGQQRSWDFNLKKGEEKSSAGSISFTLTVTSNTGGSYQIESWQVVNERGDRASVTPASGNEVTATFTKEGRYSLAAHGRTDWGSTFTVKGSTTVNP